MKRVVGIRVLTGLLATLLAVSAVAGLKSVPFDSGVAFAPTEEITGLISLAGGGVILRGISTCNSATSDTCEITSFEFLEQSDKIIVQVTANDKCVVRYETDSWLIKSAVDLVSNETDKVYRNISLLGDSTLKEIMDLQKHNIAPESVWYIEVSPPLAQTRAGETLLTLDLLLTDIFHYATDAGKARAITKELSESGVANWTWTDESAKFNFSINCKRGTLELGGQPEFTFLNPYRKAVKVSPEINHWIHSLNPTLLDHSVEFARVAAFIRYIRASHKEDWLQLRITSKKFRTAPGQTPRLLRQ